MSRDATSSSKSDPETVYKMLSLLSISDPDSDANKTLFALTNSPESCQSLRNAGCIPILIQILHPTNTPKEDHSCNETRQKAARALKNIVTYNPDEVEKRNEMRVLKLLELVRAWNGEEKHPMEVTSILAKLSFDQENRRIMCLLGATQAIADLIQIDAKHSPAKPECTKLRRHSCKILINLTFNDSAIKSLLCSMKNFMTDLVNILDSDSEELCQDTAFVIRNLSWQADSESRAFLRDSGAIVRLINTAMNCSEELTLKATLFAIANLSGHSAYNSKAIISEESLKFLIHQMSCETLEIQVNSGAVMKNIAGIISETLEWRRVCREMNLFETLLRQLKSGSARVVENACGTLAHLSSNSLEDQKRLIELDAIPNLKYLIYSKHVMIAKASKVALTNLIAAYGQIDKEPLDLSASRPPAPPPYPPLPKKPPFLNPPIVNLKTYSCPNFVPEVDTVKTFSYEGTPNCNSIQDLTDEPVKYFTEHTPACFSRTSSLSSINSRAEEPKKEVEGISSTLMASRSSSVDSLGSFVEDLNVAGSVISDFSVRESEVVSPSDLPDSPRNGYFPSSSHKKEEMESGQISARSLSPLIDGEGDVREQNDLPTRRRQHREGVRGNMPEKPLENQQELSVEEEEEKLDEMKVFALEGTPFYISTATSLSDLTSDLKDEPAKQMEVIEEPSEGREGPSSPPPHSPLSPLSPLSPMSPPVEQRTGEEGKENEIYSDVQLLQKCIKKGKACMSKSKSDFFSSHEPLDDDLKALILKGRKGNKPEVKVPPNKSPTAPGSDKSEGDNKSQKVKPKEFECIKNPRLINLKKGNFDGDKREDSNNLPSTNGQKKEFNMQESFMSVASAGSEWADETPTFSSPIPSMSISTAARIVKEGSEELIENMCPPSELSLVSSMPANMELSKMEMEGSMMSVASIRSEVASIHSIHSETTIEYASDVEREESLTSRNSSRNGVDDGIFTNGNYSITSDEHKDNFLQHSLLESRLRGFHRSEEKIPPPIPPKPKFIRCNERASCSHSDIAKRSNLSLASNRSARDVKKIPPKPPVRKDSVNSGGMYNTLPKLDRNNGEEKKVGKLAGFFSHFKKGEKGGFFKKDVWVKRSEEKPEKEKPKVQKKEKVTTV